MSVSTFKTIYPKEELSIINNELPLLMFEIKGIVDSISDIQEYDEMVPDSLVDRLKERVDEAVNLIRNKGEKN